MDQPRALLDNIRELSQQARAQLASPAIDSALAEELIARLSDCAHQAARHGLVHSELELDRLAYSLERRIGLLGEF